MKFNIVVMYVAIAITVVKGIMCTGSMEHSDLDVARNVFFCVLFYICLILLLITTRNVPQQR